MDRQYACLFVVAGLLSSIYLECDIFPTPSLVVVEASSEEDRRNTPRIKNENYEAPDLSDVMDYVRHRRFLIREENEENMNNNTSFSYAIEGINLTASTGNKTYYGYNFSAHNSDFTLLKSSKTTTGATTKTPKSTKTTTGVTTKTPKSTKTTTGVTTKTPKSEKSAKSGTTVGTSTPGQTGGNNVGGLGFGLAVMPVWHDSFRFSNTNNNNETNNVSSTATTTTTTITSFNSTTVIDTVNLSTYGLLSTTVTTPSPTNHHQAGGGASYTTMFVQSPVPGPIGNSAIQEDIELTLITSAEEKEEEEEEEEEEIQSGVLQEEEKKPSAPIRNNNNNQNGLLPKRNRPNNNNKNNVANIQRPAGRPGTQVFNRLRNRNRRPRFQG